MMWTAILVLLLALAMQAAQAEGLVVERSMELEFATNFSVEYCQGGYKLIAISDGTRYLTVPEGGQPPEGLDGDITVLRMPLTNLLVSSTPTMSLINAIGALDDVSLTTTEYADWYIPGVTAAMDAGKLSFVGSYKTPDFEVLAAAQPPFAVFSTMLQSVPDVAEKIEELGIPYMLDQSTFEDHPLARTEWVKLYGALLDREAEAQAVYDAQADMVKGIASEKTGKTVAMFYITSKGALYARNGGDYMAKMLELAGGDYALASMNPEETGTQQMEMEEFYAGAGDADYIIYIWSLGGRPETLADFLSKNEMLAEFKAVKDCNVWCTAPDYFQISNTQGEMILDMNRMLTNEDSSLAQLSHLT
ncbi:MAG TPA: ABC transporter substrate-binding protein, partial [Clostridia bacterium]|nr:ABC transporter substrate-binding protein [Clostridia bacterium]